MSPAVGTKRSWPMHDVVFAIPGDLDARTGGYLYDKRLTEELRSAGHSVEVLNLGSSFPHPTPADLTDACQRLAAVSASRIILADGLAFGALPGDVVSQLRAPVCALVHHPLALETGVPPTRAQELLATEKANLAHARQVVVTSPATAKTLSADFGVPAAKITVALPGTDVPARRRADPATPHILSVGSLTQRKGHDVLLEALCQVKDLEWRATIVGGAHDPLVAAALPELRNNLGLDCRVSFAGELDRADLDDQYLSATIFALATRYEGYGMVFAEALANHLPIVSCATGAVPETVPPEASMLVAPDDPTAFASALRAILTDRQMLARLTAGAAAAASNLPSWRETGLMVASALRRIQG